MTDPARRGRPTKATAERIATIVDAISNGVPITHAARAAGIHRSTLATWRAENPDIAAALEKAEADAVAFHVAVVKKAAASGIWTAAAWWLERTHPAEFGRKLQTDQSVTVVDQTEALAQYTAAMERAVPNEAERKRIAVEILRLPPPDEGDRW
jgi:hypothetical protein